MVNIIIRNLINNAHRLPVLKTEITDGQFVSRMILIRRINRHGLAGNVHAVEPKTFFQTVSGITIMYFWVAMYATSDGEANEPGINEVGASAVTTVLFVTTVSQRICSNRT